MFKSAIILFLWLSSVPAWSKQPVDWNKHPGKATYDSACAACHNTGVMNAPKIQQTVKWKKLAREGFDDVVGNALVGVRQMPAKGGKKELSDMQVAWAVHYLMTVSDARLAEPTDASVRVARAEGERRAAKRATR